MVRKKVDIGANRLTNQKAYSLRMRGGKSGGGKGPLLQDNISGTLSASNDQIIFQSMVATSNDDESSERTHEERYVVRRMTPREFERLQGFPDDYTRIPYKKKPKERCPDYLRIKAVGNSMPINVMRWIGERILIVNESLCAEMDEFE